MIYSPRKIVRFLNNTAVERSIGPAGVINAGTTGGLSFAASITLLLDGEDFSETQNKLQSVNSKVLTHGCRKSTLHIIPSPSESYSQHDSTITWCLQTAYSSPEAYSQKTLLQKPTVASANLKLYARMNWNSTYLANSSILLRFYFFLTQFTTTFT